MTLFLTLHKTVFSRRSAQAPETTGFSSIILCRVGATVQRWCNGGALRLKLLKAKNYFGVATVQR
jgi:hypothetical protein